MTTPFFSASRMPLPCLDVDMRNQFQSVVLCLNTLSSITYPLSRCNRQVFNSLQINSLCTLLTSTKDRGGDEPGYGWIGLLPRCPTLPSSCVQSSRGRLSCASTVGKLPRCGSNYISSGANCEKASGAASSNRVNRLRNTNLTMSVGPFRCFAIRSSVSSLSSGVAPALKKCGR
jgi:hypothetical protein